MKCIKEYWNDIQIACEHIVNVKALYGQSILITGGTGLICSPIAEMLIFLNREKNTGIKIYLAGRSRERMQKRFEDFQEGTDYIFVPYDATQNQSLNVSADYIIHGASNANPSAYMSQPVETMMANIIGLKSLLDLAVQNKSRRVLYISSSEVYGNKDEARPYRETDYGYLDILNERASYPSSKRAAETLCASYGMEYGVETVIVRPGHIYGPTITESDSRAAAQFIRNAVNGENIIMKSAGTQLRSYCHAFDCATAILTVLLNGKDREAYNISNPSSVITISKLATLLAETVGKKVVYEEASVNEKKGYNLMNNSSLDSEKLEKLGWTAMYDAGEGAKRTVEIMRKMRSNE